MTELDFEKGKLEMTRAREALEWIEQSIKNAQEAGVTYVQVFETIREALTMMDNPWQTMDTAPRDGTAILVSGGMIETELGRKEQNIDAVKVLFCGDRWDVVDTCYYTVSVLNPTRWMHLPKPPQKDESNEQRI